MIKKNKTYDNSYKSTQNFKYYNELGEELSLNDLPLDEKSNDEYVKRKSKKSKK